MPATVLMSSRCPSIHLTTEECASLWPLGIFSSCVCFSCVGTCRYMCGSQGDCARAHTCAGHLCLATYLSHPCAHLVHAVLQCGCLCVLDSESFPAFWCVTAHVHTVPWHLDPCLVHARHTLPPSRPRSCRLVLEPVATASVCVSQGWVVLPSCMSV